MLPVYPLDRRGWRCYSLAASLVELPLQPDAAVQAIRWSIGMVPAVLLICAAVCAYFYPINRPLDEEMQAKLNLKRNA